MWRNGRAAPEDEIASFLNRYASEARHASGASMFEAPSPRDVLVAIDREAFGDLPEDFAAARGYAAPPEPEPAALPDQGFDEGAASPEAEALDAAILDELRASLNVPDDVELDFVLPARRAATFADARSAAKEFQGKDLVNTAKGLHATISRASVDKMLSWKAVGKSTDPALHSLAVANADELFSRSIYGWAKPDDKADPNILQVHRLFAPMKRPEGGAVIVKMTVKETADPKTGNKLYTLEAVDVQEAASASTWVDTSAADDGLTSTLSAEAVVDIAQGVDDFNGLASLREEFADLSIDIDGTTYTARELLDDLDADEAADAVVQACAIGPKGEA